jgi:hypothetical protein
MTLTARFEEALVLAVRLHAGQTRKGIGTPYISHLLAVTGIVLEHGASEDEAIAALLHDAAEDAGGRETLEKIRERFGETVAGIVVGCTDSWTIPRPPWRQAAQCPDHPGRLSGAGRIALEPVQRRPGGNLVVLSRSRRRIARYRSAPNSRGA